LTYKTTVPFKTVGFDMMSNELRALSALEKRWVEVSIMELLKNPGISTN